MTRPNDPPPPALPPRVLRVAIICAGATVSAAIAVAFLVGWL
jgi:hypothetical protein